MKVPKQCRIKVHVQFNRADIYESRYIYISNNRTKENEIDRLFGSDSEIIKEVASGNDAGRLQRSRHNPAA